MLGLATTAASIDSHVIHKELSELDNYADLDVWFDFSRTQTRLYFSRFCVRLTNLLLKSESLNLNFIFVKWISVWVISKKDETVFMISSWVGSIMIMSKFNSIIAFPA